MEIRCTEESLDEEVQTAENEGFFFDAEPRKDLNILMMWLVFLFPMNLIGNFSQWLLKERCLEYFRRCDEFHRKNIGVQCRLFFEKKI